MLGNSGVRISTHAPPPHTLFILKQLMPRLLQQVIKGSSTLPNPIGNQMGWLLAPQTCARAY